jgi:hypothetical protein
MVGCAFEFFTNVFCPLELSRINMRHDWSRVVEMKKRDEQQQETRSFTERFQEFLARIAVKHRNNSPDNDPSLDMHLKMLLPGLPLMAVYMLCRGFKFVEDGLAFRAQPHGVYDTADWSSLLPHIG